MDEDDGRTESQKEWANWAAHGYSKRYQPRSAAPVSVSLSDTDRPDLAGQSGGRRAVTRTARRDRVQFRRRLVRPCLTVRRLLPGRRSAIRPERS